MMEILQRSVATGTRVSILAEEQSCGLLNSPEFLEMVINQEIEVFVRQRDSALFVYHTPESNAIILCSDDEFDHILLDAINTREKTLVPL
jgi:hypothetical protein